MSYNLAMHFRTRSFIHSSYALAICFLLPLMPASEATAQAQVVRGRLLTPVYLNGAGPCLMLLDLGVRHPVLDPLVVSALNLKPAEASVAGTDAAGNAVAMPTASVELQPAPGVSHVDAALIQDLTPLSQWLGIAIGGILPGHLPGYELELELSRAIISWRELAHAQLQEPGDDTLRMQIDPAGAPVVHALINGQHLTPLRLDLATTTALALASPDWDKLQLDAAEARLRLADTQEIWTRCTALKVGDTTLQDPLASLQVEQDASSLGLEFLEQVRLTLNYEYGLCRVVAAQGQRLKSPTVEGFGLALDRFEQGYWRLRVVERAPAAAAGIQSGDMLLAVDDKQVFHMPYADAAALVAATAGEQAAITVLRDGQSFTVTIESARLL